MGPRRSFLSKGSLSISLASEVLSVYPLSSHAGGSTEEDQVSEDPLIRGRVLLSLPKPKSIKRIFVQLRGLADVFGGPLHGYQANLITIERELSLRLEGETLEAGEHMFAFNFIVPSSTAVFQLCQHGRVRHYLKATVEFAGALSPAVSSAPVALWIRASAALAGEAPAAYEDNFASDSARVGPLLVNYSSRHLAVSSLLHVRLTLLAPPRDLTIQSVECYINQRFVIQTPQGSANPKPKLHRLRRLHRPEQGGDPGHGTELGPAERSPATIWIDAQRRGSESDGAPLSQVFSIESNSSAERQPALMAEVREGEEWKFEGILQVPSDEVVRPTTLRGTETRIKVSHELVLEVRYVARLARGESATEQIYLSRAVTIDSCSCLADSALLPPYSFPPPPDSFRPHAHACGCTRSVQDMRDLEGMALERAGVWPGGEACVQAEGARVLGVREREGKSAAYSSAMEGHA